MKDFPGGRRWRLGGVVVVLGALTLSAGACGAADDRSNETDEISQAAVRTTGGGNLPLYARIERSWVYHDADWAVVVFYRPPSCVPVAFNLLDLLDFGAFACTPYTTDGFSIWEHGPAVDPVPTHVVLSGLGSVPVWFVSWAEMQAGLADGVLTIGELGAMPSLRAGQATTFSETLHPVGFAQVGMIEFNGKGLLADGSGFRFHVVQHDGVGKDMQVNIDLD